MIADQNLFSKGFPTNRIPIDLPSSGQRIFIRETTVLELKSICKTIIDNLNNKRMDVIYDSVTEYLQAMILTDGVDVSSFTELDRLYCLLVFFHASFFKDPIEYKCPHCGVEINYRYDMSPYLSRLDCAYVEDQSVSVEFKNKKFNFLIGWPNVRTISEMNNHFYNKLGVVTDEMEQTQYGINFVFSFIKRIEIVDMYSNEVDFSLEMNELEWSDRIDAINSLPSSIVFEQEQGVFSEITGFFINRLENCFKSDVCPQCKKETGQGLSQSSHFYGLFYGSLRGLYGYIVQVECLLLYRYDCCIFDKEKYMTYNDLNSLVKQIGVTAEKENEERKKMGGDKVIQGLSMIRDILNFVVFPGDKKK